MRRIAFTSSVRFISLIFVLVLAQGCAGTITGDTQAISIITNPTNAKITVDSLPGEVHTAPLTLQLKRDRNHIITATLPDHNTTSTSVSSRMGTMSIIIDCVVWACIPLLNEDEKGKIGELEPANVVINLPKSRGLLDPPP